MVWLKNSLKLKIKIVLLSRERDRPLTLISLFTMMSALNICFDKKINSKKETYNYNVLFTYGILNIRRVGQTDLWIFPSISLGRDFQETVRQHCTALSVEMRDEVRRLMSFANTRIEASSIRLAAAGFFATGVGDEVMCFSCHGMYRGWQMGSDPGTVHRNMSPDCLHAACTDDRNVPAVPFHLPSPATPPVHQGATGGVPVVTTADAAEVQTVSSTEASIEPTEEQSQSNSELSEQSNTTNRGARRMGRGQRIRQVVGDTRVSADTDAEPMPRYITRRTQDVQLHDSRFARSSFPNYKSSAARRNSYQEWPQDHCKKPEDLANAGFFYAGYRDCVRCFYCGVDLRNWEREDDPWVEHVRRRPSCDYIRMMRGEQFVENTLRNLSYIEQKRLEQEKKRSTVNENTVGRETSCQSVKPEPQTLTQEFGENREILEQEGEEVEEGELGVEEEEGARGFTDKKNSNPP